MKINTTPFGGSYGTKIADLYIVHNLAAVNGSNRHTYHAMPPVGWMNDPNGFNEAFGKYHLFYQFYPYGPSWDSMHWGHYTTQDFVKWKLEPTALAPDGPDDSDGCFSGSSVVKGGRLYLIYTSVLGDRQTQSLAVSGDGVKFEKLGVVISGEQLPAGCLKTDFRDPKVFKRGEFYYLLAGAMSENSEGMILLYRSRDLTKWEYVNTLRRDSLTTRGIYECPDFFELGGWDVMLASPQGYQTEGWRYENVQSSIYMLGKFDEKKGTFEKTYEDEIDGGFDFYAPQTLKTKDGRTVMIAWMQMWQRFIPTAKHGWAGAMILPRELTMKEGKLFQSPVREIEKYRWNPVHFGNVTIGNRNELTKVNGTKIELCFTLDLGTAKKVGIKLFQRGEHDARIYYDREKDLVVFDRSRMGEEIAHDPEEKDATVRSVKVSTKNNRLSMRIFLDVSSCEVFLNGGERTMTGNVYSDGAGVTFFAEGGSAKIVSLDKYDVVV